METLYISLPITGHDLETVKQRAKNIALRYRRYFSEPRHTVTPFDVCDEKDRPYSYYMGKDIERLLECDGAVFARGWWKSKGCRLEFAAALIYGKKIKFTRL